MAVTVNHTETMPGITPDKTARITQASNDKEAGNGQA